MKPPPFAYHAPDSVEETLDLLAELGPVAKILAGGQSLVPLMNFRLVRPEALIDINRVVGLASLAEDDSSLVVGAMVRQRTLETSPIARQLCPLLVEATSHIAHLPIRSRGTLGGSMAHADPAAEYPAVAVALEAEVVAEGPSGRRHIPAADFFSGYLTTTLGPDELVVEVRFPKASSSHGQAFTEFARRPGDFAIVGVAANLTFEPDGICRTARMALSGVAPVPVRTLQAEARLRSRGIDRETMVQAGIEAAGEIAPVGDIHASPDYRRALVRDLVPRALGEAHNRWLAYLARARSHDR